MGAAAVAMAGCGGGGGESADKRLYTSAEVIDHFERETGDLLVRGPRVASGLEVLHAPSGATAMDEKYGQFSIYVVARKDTKAAIDTILRPFDKSETVAGPDASGTYWKRACPPKQVRLPRFFTAYRKFGDNLLLGWIAGKRHETDAHFDRVSRVLAGLP